MGDRNVVWGSDIGDDVSELSKIVYVEKTDMKRRLVFEPWEYHEYNQEKLDLYQENCNKEITVTEHQNIDWWYH